MQSCSTHDIQQINKTPPRSKPSSISERNTSCDKVGIWPTLSSMPVSAARHSRRGQDSRLLWRGRTLAPMTCFSALPSIAFSRDLEHSARILNILQFHDVELWTVHGAASVSSMELGLRAVLNQEVLEQVRYRTREGMKTVAKHGRVPGGICYGYRVRREFDDSGGPVRGLRSIDTDEAATIVWIFEQYADGMSPVRIAEELNARGVSGPRGRPWQGTAIRGHRNRGSGILNNQAYIGLIVFNRIAYRKNPAT